MKPNMMDAYQLMHEGALAFSRTEQYGMAVDVEYCKKAQKRLTRKLENLNEEFEATRLHKLWKKTYKNKYNPNSDQQLSLILFQRMKLEPEKRTTTGKPSVDNETLARIKMPALDILLQMKKWRKVRDTYIKGFLREQVDGILHNFFHLHFARSYRSSSSNINFQNIPIRDVEAQKICRRAIIPRSGFLILSVDYGGIEVKVSSCYNKDPNLVDYCTQPGVSMHTDMAIQLFKLDSLDENHVGEKRLRQGAKNSFVFPEFYGDYWGNCAKGLWDWKDKVVLKNGTPINKHLKEQKIGTLAKFEKHVKKVEEDFWGRRFKVYQQWKDEWWEAYQENGYFDMLTGFRCSDVMDFKQAVNTPIQGSAFHCTLWSYIQLDRELQERKMRTRLLGQIHDEMVFEVPPEELDDVLELIETITVVRLMKHWDWIIVPMEVDAVVSEVDGSWLQRNKIEFGRAA